MSRSTLYALFWFLLAFLLLSSGCRAFSSGSSASFLYFLLTVASLSVGAASLDRKDNQ